jgi:hypothetical protein
MIVSFPKRMAFHHHRNHSVSEMKMMAVPGPTAIILCLATIFQHLLGMGVSCQYADGEGTLSPVR